MAGLQDKAERVELVRTHLEAALARSVTEGYPVWTDVDQVAAEVLVVLNGTEDPAATAALIEGGGDEGQAAGFDLVYHAMRSAYPKLVVVRP